MPEITPLFLFSLPRAGSTLLQRMIAAHPAVATSAEPWLLLPCLDMLGHRGSTFSTYAHQLAVQAIDEFAAGMEGGRKALRDELRGMVLRLYRRAAGEEAEFFLDKTPRYHSHCASIIELFPEARPVVLHRHPLAVVASMLETFAEGKWYLYGYRIDLYDGLAALDAAVQRFGEQVLSVRYEDLVREPDTTMRQVFDHLGLAGSEEAWSGFGEVELAGNMKDPTGISRYRKLSNEPLDKWKQTFSNPYRIAWARRYLDWIGEARLQRMGYDLHAMHSELDALDTNWRGVGGDLLRAAYGAWRTWHQADIADDMAVRPWQRRYIVR